MGQAPAPGQTVASWQQPPLSFSNQITPFVLIASLHGNPRGKTQVGGYVCGLLDLNLAEVFRPSPVPSGALWNGFGWRGSTSRGTKQHLLSESPPPH